jgi:hypothetical protein
VTGFFEESEGVRSMSRLAIFVLLLLAAALVGAIVGYVFYVPTPSDAVILALVAALTAVVFNGAVAIIKRNGGEGDA